ncbi:MAG: glycosyltransferase family A protein [Anaerolineales bacterium]|jgi:glycosyltransferase involved in cell wall biosynthesis|nr:glycosyltransferase family A protein [Anaerolineales bacterium]
MNCSIVIRAYNEARHLPRLLEGLRQQTVQDLELILVDSGSTDDTLKIAESFGAKIVQIAPADFTFGRSLNLGIGAATRELVAIASAHVYPVYSDWLERLLEPFADPTVGLTYGKQRGAQTSKFSEHQIFARWFADTSDLRQTHPFCNNANAAIRRSLWEQNPYDESLTGLEDLAWAKWARAQGHHLAYIADAEIIHIHAETPTGVQNRYRREAMAFKRIYPEAHFNAYDFLRMTLGNIFNDSVHAARERLLVQAGPEIFWFRFNQFWGTYQGYRQSAEWSWSLRQTFYYPRGLEADTPAKREVEPIRYSQP